LCCKKLRRNQGSIKLSHLFHLGTYSKEAGDKGYLTFDIPSRNIVDLSFTYHAHHLISLECSRSRFKRKETHPRFDKPLNEPMILFHQIVEVFYLSQFHTFKENPCRFQLGNRFGIRGVLIERPMTRGAARDAL
jgi:hypothetical protein